MTRTTGLTDSRGSIRVEGNDGGLGTPRQGRAPHGQGDGDGEAGAAQGGAEDRGEHGTHDTRELSSTADSRAAVVSWARLT